jgi:hypothetical protein
LQGEKTPDADTNLIVKAVGIIRIFVIEALVLIMVIHEGYEELAGLAMGADDAPLYLLPMLK